MTPGPAVGPAVGPGAGPAVGAAVTAARAVGRDLGLPVGEPVVLHDGANVVVHLAPAPVVARVAALTARARARPGEHLAREVALATALAARSAPVLPPTAVVDPGPHERDGQVLSLWPLVEVSGHVVDDPTAVAAALAALHHAAGDLNPRDLNPSGVDPAGYPGLLACTQEASAALTAGGGWLPDAELAALRARQEGAAATARRADSSASRQVLHGDAHPRNLLATGSGALWCDLEDTVFGPVEWDLAVVARSRHHDGAAALAAYASMTGRPVDDALLADLVALRSWQADCWAVLFADVHPERRAAVLAALGAGSRTVSP